MLLSATRSGSLQAIIPGIQQLVRCFGTSGVAGGLSEGMYSHPRSDLPTRVCVLSKWLTFPTFCSSCWLLQSSLLGSEVLDQH